MLLDLLEEPVKLDQLALPVQRVHPAQSDPREVQVPLERLVKLDQPVRPDLLVQQAPLDPPEQRVPPEDPVN